MDAPTILLDTSILIEFLRKRDKSKSILHQLVDEYRFCISVITDFEIKVGIQTQAHRSEYDVLTQNIEILPIDRACINEAAAIFKALKSANTMIELADLLIGATAVSNSLPLATLNTKHFDRIADVNLVGLPATE